MAVNIFDKYGIKEVANVYFEALDDDIAAGVYAGDIVLFLDTLKVSTIETSAENVAARGGWGNPRLVQWDYGKEINLTLTDALLSLESLRFMLGGAIKRPKAADSVIVRHTEEVVCKAGGIVPKPISRFSDEPLTPTATYGHPIRLINLTTGARTQLVVSEPAGSAITIDGNHAINFVNPSMLADETSNTKATAQGDHIRIFWETEVTSEAASETAVEVTISPDTFPGTYKVVGDTFMRSEKTGKDEPFQFIINKAKVQSNVTITLEAEGDPSTFEMTLNVLRSTNEDGKNEMMKLIRYNISSTDSSETGDDYGSIGAGGSNP
jgi:hypothetical protein